MKDKNKLFLWITIAAVALLVIAIAFSVIQVTSLKKQVDVAQAENEQLQLTNEQLSLSNEFAAINKEFAMYENQATQVANDTIMAKYTAAKQKVEELIKELNSEKKKSRERCVSLKARLPPCAVCSNTT